MTWTTRILAILNILAAGALFYYVGQSAYKRADYSNRLQQLRETRDGLITVEWFQKLKQEDRLKLVDTIVITDELLAKLPPADAQALREMQSRREGQINELKRTNEQRAREGRPPLYVPYRAESDMARRDAMGRLPYNPVNRLGEIVAGPAMIPFEVDEEALYRKDDKGNYVGEFKLRLRPDGRPRTPEAAGNPVRLTLIGKAAEIKEIEEMARLLGFEGFKRLYRESVLLHQSKLAAEETAIADRKASLLAIQARYQQDLVRFREETANLKSRVEAEKDLRAVVYRENDERRAELARIYSEMGESFAAREAALGRLRDAERQLTDAREDIRTLTEEIQKYHEQISGLESNKNR